ncbi:MAG: TIGR04013 family B12-binding domain/radical SAM domain-containing protein [Candidatus Eisenbacteria bacterium]
MKNRVRFTFVRDRLNRTAIASLVAALECEVDDVSDCVRVTTPKDLLELDFDRSGRTVEVVCVSSMTVNFPSALRLIKILKKRWGTDAFITLSGGAHSSGQPLKALSAGIDYCCVGEGEDVIREVARNPAAGESLSEIAGVYRLEGEILQGKPRTVPVDLSSFPALPTRMRFPTYIEIGRGCSWGCGFCQTPGIHGRVERFRSVAEIEDIVSVYADFGMKDFRFLLPNSLGYASDEAGKPNCDVLEDLLVRSRSVSKGGRLYLGSFPSEVRPDYVTEDAIRILKAHVSNTKLVIGGQSGSDRMLESIGRGHGVEAIRRSCDIISSCGFVPAVDMVLGFPGETSDDRQATFAFVEKLGATGTIFYIHFFMPLPGTPLAGGDPVFLTDDERRNLDRLAQEGIVRGRWRSQEELAGE